MNQKTQILKPAELEQELENLWKDTVNEIGGHSKKLKTFEESISFIDKTLNPKLQKIKADIKRKIIDVNSCITLNQMEQDQIGTMLKKLYAIWHKKEEVDDARNCYKCVGEGFPPNFPR